MEVPGLATGFLIQPGPDTLAYLRRRGFCERHDENFLERGPRFLLEKAIEAPFHQRARLASTGTGHHEHIATRGDGFLLGFS
jgi:hypothetical protein